MAERGIDLVAWAPAGPQTTPVLKPKGAGAWAGTGDVVTDGGKAGDPDKRHLLTPPATAATAAAKQDACTQTPESAHGKPRSEGLERLLSNAAMPLPLVSPSLRHYR